MPVYRSPAVAQVADLYRFVIDQPHPADTVKEQLSRLAGQLLLGLHKGHPGAAVVFANWHPGWAGQEAAAIFQRDGELSNARLAVAREHGFADWDQVEAEGMRAFTPDFERAVDALLAGDQPGLQALIAAQPELLTVRSPYGHRATLLHYAGSNGVETRRQLVPHNLPELVTFLLTAGADPAATARCYGGSFTPYELAASSAHPRQAGIQEALLAALRP